MKFWLVLVLALPGSLSVYAQHATDISERGVNLPKDKHLFVLPPDTRWHEQRWADSTYLFPRDPCGKSKIREYERSHSIDYNKKEDLLKIVSYFNKEL